MTMPITFTYKRGVSLYFGSQLLGDDGQPTTGTGVDVSCLAKHVETGEAQTLELVWCGPCRRVVRVLGAG